MRSCASTFLVLTFLLLRFFSSPLLLLPFFFLFFLLLLLLLLLLGNDFLLVYVGALERAQAERHLRARAADICTRAGQGVGADGIMLITPPPVR